MSHVSLPCMIMFLSEKIAKHVSAQILSGMEQIGNKSIKLILQNLSCRFQAILWFANLQLYYSLQSLYSNF